MKFKNSQALLWVAVIGATLLIIFMQGIIYSYEDMIDQLGLTVEGLIQVCGECSRYN